MTTTALDGNGGERDGRGRLKGKSPLAIVRNCGLPPQLGEAVLAVTGKTRLWPWERAEVARELCGHFLDGLEAGATADELRNSFGDPRAAARLITRAKKRNRPWAWKAMRRTVLMLWCLLAFVVAWYGWNAARFYLSSPTIRFNIQAELNAASVAVPLEQRGWPLYRDAARSLRTGETHADSALEMLEGWPNLKPGTDEWAKASAFLDARPGVVAKIRHAAAMDRSAYVITELNTVGVDYTKHPELAVPEGVTADPSQNPIGWSVLLPQLGNYRSLARVLVFDTHRAVEDRRSADAVANIEALLGLARHAREDGTLIAQLVSIAIDTLAIDTLNDAVTRHADLFTDEQLARLSHAVGSCRTSPTPAGSQRVDLSWERRFFEDTLQRFYTDDGSGDGRLCKGVAAYGNVFGQNVPGSSKYLNPVIAGVVAGRKETSELMASLISDVELQNARPLYERDWSTVDHRVAELKSGGFGVRYSLAAMMIPSLTRAQMGLDILLTQRDASAAGLAVELYKRKTGRYPTGWAELTPRYLPGLPIDRWSGRALGYKPAGAPGGRPLIYSVGADKTDDGGVIGTPWFAFNAAVSPVYAAVTGDIPTKDWVIWPPVEDVGKGPMTKMKPISVDKGYQWGWLGSLMGN